MEIKSNGFTVGKKEEETEELRAANPPVCPGLRGFPGHGPSIAKTGRVLGRLGQLVTPIVQSSIMDPWQISVATVTMAQKLK